MQKARKLRVRPEPVAHPKLLTLMPEPLSA
jgi:hypothetical protein